MLSEILSSIKDRKILVIGDIMLDHYITGDATRISPEAPVPVVAVENENYTLGAAANVALNIISCGADVELCGTVGDDQSGEQLVEILKDRAITFNAHFIKKNADTIVKTRVIARGQQLCRIDRERRKSVYEIISDTDLQYIETRIKQCDAVILSDYNKGVLGTNNVAQFVNWAKKYKKFISLDPKPSNKLKFNGVDLMTPNKIEAYDLAGLNYFENSEEQFNIVCDVINKRYNPKSLIITLGAEGMLLSVKGDIEKIMPTCAREVFDVSGAGDTVIAALTLAMSSGVHVYDAMHFANIVAGVVVGKHGTAVASPDEILNFHK